jgi:hypothetical protein
MNGVHDMGGEQDMGPIKYEKNEPVFHAPWEGRVYGMNRLMGAWGKWSLDASRHIKELLPPADYFRMSYYETWLDGLIKLTVESGLATSAEIESGSRAGLVQGNPANHRRQCGERTHPPVRATAGGSIAAFRSGPARARAQHKSDWSHAPAALRAGQVRDSRSRSRCISFPGHQRPFPRREATARLFGPLRGARAVG